MKIMNIFVSTDINQNYYVKGFNTFIGRQGLDNRQLNNHSLIWLKDCRVILIPLFPPSLVNVKLFDINFSNLRRINAKKLLN